MFKNILKTAWRGIVRSRKYAVLNIAGLATGLAACLLMAGFVIHELSYETLHPLRDRIYRINAEIPMAGGMIKNAVVSAPLGPAAVESLPEVEMSTRLLRLHNKVVRAGDREFSFKRCHAAEPWRTRPTPNGWQKRSPPSPGRTCRNKKRGPDIICSRSGGSISITPSGA